MNAHVTITMPGGSTLQTDHWYEGDGEAYWSNWGASLGAHIVSEPSLTGKPFSLRVAACVLYDGQSAGGVRFSRIEIEFGQPVCCMSLPGVTAVRSEGTKIVIGGDGQNHCIPAGHAIRVRFALGTDVSTIYSRERLEDSVSLAPGVSATLPAAFRGITFGWGAPGSGFGIEGHVATPIGERYGQIDQGAPGMAYIDFVPGYDRNGEIALRRCDAMMNAWPLEARGFNGHLMDSLFEGLDGWWHWWKPRHQIDAFLGDPVPGQEYAQTRYPKWWNEGACAYENYAAGLMTYRDSQAQNLEHLRRITGPLECAVRQWGDRLAAIDLEVVARTMRAAFRQRIDEWTRLARQRVGLGHHELGGRGPSWLADLLMMHPATEAHGRAIARATAAMQMPNGCVKRKPGPWYSSPDPYVPGTGINCELPLSTEASQTMEETITAYMLARAGEIDAARRFLDRLYVTTRGMFGQADECLYARAGYVPKFVGTTDAQGRPLRRWSNWTDGQDYARYAALGLGIFLSRDPAPFLAAMRPMQTPHTGRALGSAANAISVLRDDEIGKEQTSLLVSALESL